MELNNDEVLLLFAKYALIFWMNVSLILIPLVKKEVKLIVLDGRLNVDVKGVVIKTTMAVFVHRNRHVLIKFDA